MIIIGSILVLLFIILLMGRINLSAKFGNEVATLFAESDSMSNHVYQHRQLEDLPEPVQRYFRYVLKEGQAYISYARIKHDGQFKTGLDKNWINIKGEQYATTATPGFIWKGTTALFVARDMYISGKGRLVVLLFSLFKVADARGEHYNQGELLRWLGESLMYPTNLLPSDRLQWQPVDANTARLSFHYKGLDLFFLITFNAKGEITEMETKRYMDAEKSETWVIRASDYQEWNGVKIPVSFDVIWRLKNGDLSYAKFNITHVEYDIAERF